MLNRRTAVQALLDSRRREVGSPRLDRVLDRASRLIEPLEDRWASVEELCADAPRTIRHGDALGKNVPVRRSGAAIEVVPIDWASSGMGPAATCLGQLDLPGHPSATGPDQYSAYREVVRSAWPALDESRIEQLAALGRLFWGIQAVGWGIDSLAWTPVDEAAANLEIYVDALASAVHAAAWYPVTAARSADR